MKLSFYNMCRTVLTFPVVLMFFTAFLFARCSKRTLDAKPNLAVITPASNSSARVIDLLGGAHELIINGKKLTNFIPILFSNASGNPAAAMPTPWFTANGKYSGQFTIPDSLFRNGKAEVIIGDLSWVSQGAPKDTMYVRLDTVINNGNIDLFSGRAGTTFIINRNIIPPTDPTKFKIRLINLLNTFSSDQVTPVTLTFADGAPVSAATSHISFNGGISDYVELPYGSYQFHVFDAGGVPVPEPFPAVDGFNYYTTIDSYDFPNFSAPFAQIRTFQPGGIYTVLLSPTFGKAMVVEDNKAVNNSYGRMQFVNAIPGSSAIDVLVDGSGACSGLKFGQYADFGIYPRGPHQISISDRGKTLAQMNISLEPGDALTIWTYHDNSSYKLLYTNTDMSISVNFGNYYNQSRTLTLAQAIQVRFLNLCPDLPFASFANSGQIFPAVLSSYANTLLSSGRSSIHIPFGQVLTDSPYMRILDESGIPRAVTVHASPSDAVSEPGVSVPGVDSLINPFLANPGMYPSKVPRGEQGLYTIALIGRATNDTSAAEKARLIVIKHNK